MTLPTPASSGVYHWACLAWVEQHETFERCGAPAICVDPVFGGPVCESHRRTAAVQDMTCCQCRQPIEPGDSFEFYQGIDRRCQDGSDPLICQPCLRNLIRETLATFARISPIVWEDTESGLAEE